MPHQNPVSPPPHSMNHHPSKTITSNTSRNHNTKSILSFYRRQKKVRDNNVSDRNGHPLSHEDGHLSRRMKMARRSYKRAFMNQRNRRRSVIEEDMEEGEGCSLPHEEVQSPVSPLSGRSARRGSIASFDTTRNSGTASSSRRPSASPRNKRRPSSSRLHNGRRSSSVASSASSAQRPKSASSVVTTGKTKRRRASVRIPHAALETENRTTDSLGEWNIKETPRRTEGIEHHMKDSALEKQRTNDSSGSAAQTKTAHPRRKSSTSHRTASSGLKRKRPRPRTASETLAKRRYTEPLLYTVKSPRQSSRGDALKSDISRSKTKSSLRRRLSLPYPGAAPSSVYDRHRLSMSRWEKRPKSAKTNSEVKRITMLLYEKHAPARRHSNVGDETEMKKLSKEERLRQLEEEALQKQLGQRRISRASFRFLEEDLPQDAKQLHNLSEQSFKELKEYIKKEELRAEIFKYDHFIPHFRKSQLNMYRLGSHNNAYDSYDTLDYIVDKRMYEYMDQHGLETLRQRHPRVQRRRHSSVVAHRGGLTKEFIKSAPLHLGVDRDRVLKNRVKGGELS